MPIAFTIDFERLAHARAYRELDSDPDITLDLDSITTRLLDLFERTNNRVTFYVVAEIAESYPDLVRRIHDAGHEIGSHTYSHRLLPKLSQAELETEISESKAILESVIGERIHGFRAPELNHDRASLRGLCEAGYAYDSSAIDSIPIPGFYASWDNLESSDPQQLDFDFGSITEIPLSVNPLFRLPASGAWIRLLGRRYTMLTLRMLKQRDQIPICYLHSRAFQTIPRASGLPRRICYRSGDWTFDLLTSIMHQYDSVPVRDLLAFER